MAYAVACEPVSSCEFPANREINREFSKFGSFGKLLTPAGEQNQRVLVEFPAQRKREFSSDYQGDSCQHQSEEQSEEAHRHLPELVVPWKKTPSKRPREIILPASTSSHSGPRPIRAETRVKLVAAIAKGRQWLDELIAATATNVEQIATREKCSIRQVNRTITLAFIAPTLVQTAVDGRLPRGIGVAAVRDFPAEWTCQYDRLGLSYIRLPDPPAGTGMFPVRD